MMLLSRDEINAKLSDYLEELFEVPRDQITPDARLYEDLNLDSIDAVDLIVKIQELTGRRIAPEQFKAVRTVNDIIACVERILSIDAAVEV